MPSTYQTLILTLLFPLLESMWCKIRRGRESRAERGGRGSRPVQAGQGNLALRMQAVVLLGDAIGKPDAQHCRKEDWLQGREMQARQSHVMQNRLKCCGGPVRFWAALAECSLDSEQCKVGSEEPRKSVFLFFKSFSLFPLEEIQSRSIFWIISMNILNCVRLVLMIVFIINNCNCLSSAWGCFSSFKIVLVLRASSFCLTLSACYKFMLNFRPMSLEGSDWLKFCLEWN